MLKRTKLRKISKRPLTGLKREAIKVFNAWIRRRDKLELGGRCFICGNPNAAHAAHFIHNKNNVRFNEINCNLCCTLCNVFKSGNLGEYAVKLIEAYGLEKVQELRRLATITKRFSRQDYEKIIKKYS